MDSRTLEKLGIKIGHYTDSKNLTGATVFIAEKGAEIGIDIRGSNTGTFNTPAYDAKASSETVNCVILSGGSVFGLEAAFGAMQYLEEQKIGYKNHLQTPPVIIPGVTGAVIYDLGVGSGSVRPGKKEGYAAAKSSSFSNLDQGNVGVGTGATVGKWFKGRKMKGGFGLASTTLPNGIVAGAFAVTNSIGDIVNPTTNKFYSDEGNYGLGKISPDSTKLHGLRNLPSNTTLAVIATNVALDRRQLMKVAELAHDGMARSVFPVHTTLDGDVVFALSSLSGERKIFPKTSRGTIIDLVGLAAQDALMKAIKNSVVYSKGIDGFPSYK